MRVSVCIRRVYLQTLRPEPGSLCQTTERMNNTVKIERPADAPEIAVIVIDNPPVNAIGNDVYEGLITALDPLSGDASVKAVLITAAGRTFIAGADIKLLEQAGRGEGGRLYLHPLLEKIETFPKPVVVALHGTALGGGMELAMSAHYQIGRASCRER